MKTSFHDTRVVDAYLRGRLPLRARTLFERALRSDVTLRRDLYFQKLTYRLIRSFHRRRLREELMDLHASLFEDPEKRWFQQSVLRCFGGRS